MFLIKEIDIGFKIWVWIDSLVGIPNKGASRVPSLGIARRTASPSRNHENISVRKAHFRTIRLAWHLSRCAWRLCRNPRGSTPL